MELDGLWEKYLEEPFKRFAPRFLRWRRLRRPAMPFGSWARWRWSAILTRSPAATSTIRSWGRSTAWAERH